MVSARAAGIETLIGVSAWTDSLAKLRLAKPPVTITHPGEVWGLLRSPQTEADRFLHRVIRVHASEPKHGYPGVWKSPRLFGSGWSDGSRC